MGSAQQFSLRWNNYSQHIVTALDDLRSEDELTDVTLSCEGQKIKAHKILLSACSTYFRETFRENPCKHPVIILKGVSLVDLQAVVTFMYNGQVNVTQDRLPSFLQTAELLQIKGLTDMNDRSEREDGPVSTSSALKKRVVNQNNLNSNSDNRSQTPESVQRPPTPKRRKMVGASGSNFQNQHSESSLTGNSFNSPNAIAGPSSSMNSGGSSGGGGSVGPVVGGGLINPASVLMAQSDSNSAEDYPHPGMLKFEEEEVLDDDEDFRNNLSEEGDNSMQDLGNVDQGAMASAQRQGSRLKYIQSPKGGHDRAAYGGFIYDWNTTGSKALYYGCDHKRIIGCRARLIVYLDGSVKVTNPHLNHLPDPDL